MNNPKPKFYLRLKIIGFTLLLSAITLFVLSFIIKDDDFGGPNFIFIIPASFTFVFSFPLLIFGFQPEITKASLKNTRYIQQETKDIQKNIATTTEEISHDAIVNAANAVKTGFKDYKYCKHCGEKIDEDSAFCKFCGKGQ